MAQTYTVAEALSLISRQIGKSVENDYAAYLANVAQNVIWNRYDWRESLAELPPFYLIANEQEYGPPAVVIPSDFQGLREAYLINLNGIPAKREPIKVLRDIRLTHAEALPGFIGYEPARKLFRVFPRVPSGVGSTAFLIDGTYKTKPTKITPDKLQTTLIPWDDDYLQVFLAALKWAAYDAASDPRAGKVTLQNGMAAYDGQLGVMHDLIDQMAQNEGLNLGDPAIAPAEPLVYSPNYGSLFPGMGLL